MSETATQSGYDPYGTLIDGNTLRIQRLLPGPIERIWDYLTDSELRRQWLAAGDMTLAVGEAFEFVWRNDELTDPPGRRPDGYGEEHRMLSRITELEPPRRLAIEWGRTGGVTFELEPRGSEVLLTLTHHRVPDRSTLLSVSSGWHAHLDVLVARAQGRRPEPFWDCVEALKEAYEQRLPA
ncbi:SRPBCC family protein [Marinobacter sp. JSM 1782161]|uniref:SRPBCC family protein n=1 Tax=Marinobacter sp. JSM 1782161 TaxID=2685906 RepID=UPI0014033A1F|nr:SRPBCC family protein [Marinobacter sp. JSM 1782161]